MSEENRTCVNRFIGVCKDCIIDYDIGKYPNNLDCPRYEEMHVIKYEVVDRRKEE